MTPCPSRLPPWARRTAASPQIRVRPADQAGDLGWVVMAHGELYAREFGWDSVFEGLVARIVADYATEHDPQRAWIGELDGQRAGCIFCVAGDEEGTAKLRILLVDPVARGHGLGRGLVDTCVEFAQSAGYRRITVWTNDVLGSARRIYQAVGFELVKEERHHSFGHELVGQYWTRDLQPAAGVGAPALGPRDAALAAVLHVHVLVVARNRAG